MSKRSNEELVQMSLAQLERVITEMDPVHICSLSGRLHDHGIDMLKVANRFANGDGGTQPVDVMVTLELNFEEMMIVSMGMPVVLSLAKVILERKEKPDGPTEPLRRS